MLPRTRIKSEIIRVGTITFTEWGGVIVMDWWFDSTDCTEEVPWEDAEYGLLFGGYTPTELKVIETEQAKKDAWERRGE